jgi:hypothetical protein
MNGENNDFYVKFSDMFNLTSTFFLPDVNSNHTQTEPICGTKKYDYTLQCISDTFVDTSSHS